MTQLRQALVTSIALATLVTTPLAWGCEATGMQSCVMSDCPMTAERAAKGCHEPVASVESGSIGCEATPEAVIACCAVPVDQEPAKFDSFVARDSVSQSFGLTIEQIEIEPPRRPPELISRTVLSREYERGRCSLLSSYLL